MVTIKEPKAKVPKWYLRGGFEVSSQVTNVPEVAYRIVRPMPTVRVKNGTSDLWKVQYQVAKVAARTISPKADMKKIAQKKPTTFKTWK